MKLFGRQPIAKRAARPAEPTASEIAEASDCQTRVNAFVNKYGMQPLEYTELSTELDNLHMQSGTARGGDRIAELSAMILNSTRLIRALNTKPPTPENIQAKERLLVQARKLNAELQNLKKGSRRSKSKRTTRRKQM
jgi:hypothetical protein